MKRNDNIAVTKLLENNTSVLISLCNDFSKVSDSGLEQMIQTYIQEDLRIVQKLKTMLK